MGSFLGELFVIVFFFLCNGVKEDSNYTLFKTLVIVIDLHESRENVVINLYVD